MFGNYQESEQTVPVSLFADLPDAGLPDLFPNETWSDQRTKYDRYWYYYSGDVLKEHMGNQKDAPLRYPAGLNFAKAACHNHAALLIGQPDDQNGLLRFGLVGESNQQKEKLLQRIASYWRVNKGDDKFLTQALNMMIFGGAFYRINIDVKRMHPVSFTTIDPRAVFPVADTYDPDRIISVDIVTEMPVIAAMRRYHIKKPNNAGEYVTVREHWDEDEFFVEVDGHFALWSDGTEMRGKNIYKDPITGHNIVPVVYIPRTRTNDFYGESVVEDVMSIQDEINTGASNIGDGVSESMHQQVWIRNRKNGIDGLDLDRSTIMDLGSSPLGGDPPELGRLDPVDIQPAAVDYVFDKFPKLARELIGLPDVSWGRNDGSVRSALTLHYMMYPSVNAGIKYRQHFAGGMRELLYKSAIISNVVNKVTTSAGITIGQQQFTERNAIDIYEGLQIFWQPMLPQDRTDLVNEITQRIATNTISVETAIAKFDGENTAKDEVERIKAEIKEGILRKPDTQDTKFGQKPDLPSDRTNKAQALGGREKGKNAKSTNPKP